MHWLHPPAGDWLTVPALRSESSGAFAISKGMITVEAP
jgi:hypothetical protein